MPNERTLKKPREQYRPRTRLIHRSLAPGRWGYDQHVFYPRLANFAPRGLAQRQMTTPDGSLAPGHTPYFELKGKNGEVRSAAEAAGRLVDYIAEKSYTVTLAVSLGQIQALVENRFSMTHALVPEEEKIGSGLRPGGIRLSLRLEDWHDIIADLEDAREVLWPKGQVMRTGSIRCTIRRTARITLDFPSWECYLSAITFFCR